MNKGRKSKTGKIERNPLPENRIGALETPLDCDSLQETKDR